MEQTHIKHHQFPVEFMNHDKNFNPYDNKKFIVFTTSRYSMKEIQVEQKVTI